MSKKLPIVFFVGVFLLVAVISAKSYFSIDPDFGWRITAGQLYLRSGIPQTDPFTYTMPSFHWVDHAWISTLLMGFLYPNIGMLGLSVLFSFLCVTAILAAAFRFDRKNIIEAKVIKRLKGISKVKVLRFLDIPFILSIVIIFPFTGIRAQVFTWIFLALFLKFLFDRGLWEKYRHLTPFYFLLWSNIHGGYISGLTCLFLYLLAKTLKERKINYKEAFIFVASTTVTLINPYGFGNWREVWSSVSDTSLRFSIAEWVPSIFRMDFAFVYYLTFSLVLVVRYFRKFTLGQMFIYFFFLIQAVTSLRNVVLWVIVSLALSSQSIIFFYEEVVKDKISTDRFVKVYKGAWFLAIFIFLFEMSFGMYSSLSLQEHIFYPQGAVKYLNNQDINGNVFSEYGWGGYLIWKYPQKKVFVDGRMPSWREVTIMESEETSAFETYKDVLTGDIDYRVVFAKYDINTLLWPKRKTEKGLYDILQEKLDNLLALFGKEKNNFNLIDTIDKDGWQLIYEDNNAVIYKNLSNIEGN